VENLRLNSSETFLVLAVELYQVDLSLRTHGDVTIEPLYADFHIHTVYSADSVIQPKTLVDKLVAHSFIKVAAVTDHDSVRGCKATVELAAAYPDILVIPGVEVSTTEGDVVVLGTYELPPKPWTPEAVVDFARLIGGVSIVAHPFRTYGMGERARKYKVDAIEVLNGGSSQDANDEAKDFAKNLGLPGTAGSDAHQMSELFSVYNKVDSAMDIDSVLKAIKNGAVSAQASRGSIHF
jgi:predicted metal-dependent phosphoesterase TrpH